MNFLSATVRGGALDLGNGALLPLPEGRALAPGCASRRSPRRSRRRPRAGRSSAGAACRPARYRRPARPAGSPP
ncbi:hypothetical protein [Mangrovicoccus ximenensis]|uniref:hypothetical protein n=1 Tax=Mangrovicoccus ximenensis TaxID=1911570 RepID=UPI0038B2F20D